MAEIQILERLLLPTPCTFLGERLTGGHLSLPPAASEIPSLVLPQASALGEARPGMRHCRKPRAGYIRTTVHGSLTLSYL